MLRISIHALLAESDALSQSSAKSTPEISIHALLAESDPPRGGYCYLDNIISIHALLAESDLICQAPILPCNAFLSTLSLRRATRHKTSKLIINIYFYPRSPCGERPYGRINDISRLIFLSTLSLRRATVAGSCLNGVIGFLSTLSLRRATSGSKGRPATQAISIHALLAESDLIDPEIKIATERFLSTLSLRRATSKGSVSIPRYRNFYPRSPCGERPCPTISANTCF